MSSYFRILGSDGMPTLKGEISVVGAKNAALKGIAASVLFNTPVRLSNVPHIEDVSRMLDIIRAMGGSAEFEDHHLTVDSSKLNKTAITSEIAKRLRASVVLTGPILARAGRVEFPHPGGC